MRILQVARVVVVSPEFAGALAVTLAFCYFPWIGNRVASLLTEETNSRYFFLGAPFGGLLVAYKLTYDLLHPKDDDTERRLYGWADYGAYKKHAIIGLLWCVLGVGCSTALLVLAPYIPGWWTGTCYATVTVAWLVSIATLAWAKLKISGFLRGEQ